MEFKPLNADEYYARENAFLVNRTIAELEAKVYVYEKIIANSNLHQWYRRQTQIRGFICAKQRPQKSARVDGL